jgi:nicotinamide mononucleotide transporter
MSIYGWYIWTRKTNNKTIEITWNSKRDWMISFSFFVICWIVLYLILKNYTTSTVPLGDSFASATAYTGMWQMTRKKIENWIWWILTNTASIPLYFYKGAVFTSFQYIIFLILAIAGFVEWKKKLALNKIKLLLN